MIAPLSDISVSVTRLLGDSIAHVNTIVNTQNDLFSIFVRKMYLPSENIERNRILKRDILRIDI